MANNSLPDGFSVEQDPAPAGPGALPDGFQLDEQKFGGVGNAAKAAGLGAARTLSLGLSDYALTRSGAMDPQTIQGLEDNQKAATLAGEGGGLVAAHFYGVGEAEDAIQAAKVGLKAAKAAGNAAEITKATQALSTVKNVMGAGDLLNPVRAITKIGGKVSTGLGGGILATGAAGAAEGALFGAGNAISETSLGDPNLAAENLMHNVGYGALLGGGLGLGFGAISKGLKSIPGSIGAASDTLKQASGKVDDIIGDTPRGDAPIIDAQPKTGVQPTSIEDLIKRNADAIANGESVDLPQKQALIDAASRVEMKNPVNPMQVDSLSSQAKRDSYKILKEVGGEGSDAINGNELRQKAELVDHVDKTIQDLSPNVKVTPDAVEGGQKAADAFSEVIQKNRAELGPKIAEMKAIEGKQNHLPGVLDALTNPDMPHGNPSLAKMFDTSEQAIKIKPWDSTMGIEKKTYQNVKQAIKDVQKDQTNFGNLFNIRKALASGVNVMDSGDASRELTKAKAALMDHIQSVIQKDAPSEDVRGWFKKYAINEENAKIIEKKFGAEIGSDNFRSIAKNKPQEKILDNIFRDSESVKAAKRILSPEKFNEMLANHLAEQRARVTTDNAFSSSKFNTYLRGNQDALNEAFADNPLSHLKLKDVTTMMRILPDSPLVNPGGTAKTLLGSLKAHSIPDLLNNLKEFGLEKFNRQQAIDEINQKLAGRAEKISHIDKVASFADKTGKLISSKLGDILNDTGATGLAAAKLTPEEYLEKTKKIAETANNPQGLHDKISKATQSIYETMPNVSGSLQSSLVAATGFLNSKIPQQNHGPFVKPTDPTSAEIAKFNKYYSVVHNPTIALDQIKNRTLSNETMETLQAVYPQMYQQMKTKLMEQVTAMKDPTKIPYKTKMILSHFLGQPLHPSLSPQSIASNQAVYAPPQQQQPKPNQAGMAKIKLANRTTLSPNDEV